jgi:hypothetical protein
VGAGILCPRARRLRSVVVGETGSLIGSENGKASGSGGFDCRGVFRWLGVVIARRWCGGWWALVQVFLDGT